MTETIMIVFAILNAMIALGSHKQHKKWIVPGLFISGILLLLMNFVAHAFIQQNEYLITIGAFFIGIGHLLNNQLCKHCKTCQLNNNNE